MLKLITLLLLFCQLSYAQDEKSDLGDFVFENVLANYREFDYKIHNAYLNQDYDKVENIFRDFIEDNLHNKIMNNFTWNKFRTRHKSLYDIDLPIYLMTRSSWSLPNIGEIAAINKLAKKYKKKIKFVVLFWDKRKKMKKQGRRYSRHVDVVYIDEMQNKDAYTIKALKHALGVPTTFIINKNKRVMDVDRPAATPFHIKESQAKQNCVESIEDKIHHAYDSSYKLISEKSSADRQ